MSGLTFDADGAPDVCGLPAKTIGNPANPDGPLLVRYFLRGESGGDAPKVFIHHLLRSDEDRAFHDHPWDFTTFLLTGRYIEHTPHGDTYYAAPAVLQRKAEHKHWLELPDGPMWTMLLVGHRRREWGFWASDMPWTHWQQFDPTAGTRP